MTGYREMRVYVVGEDKIVSFDRGTGDNLLQEDYDEGFVDYIYYTIYNVADLDDVYEEDGGMVLLENYFGEEFGNEDGTINWNKVAERVMEFIGYGAYVFV